MNKLMGAIFGASLLMAPFAWAGPGHDSGNAARETSASPNASDKDNSTDPGHAKNPRSARRNGPSPSPAPNANVNPAGTGNYGASGDFTNGSGDANTPAQGMAR